MKKKKRNARPADNKVPEQVFVRHQNSVFWVLFSLITVFAFFRVFWGLADAPIFDWDEARHGITAYEMFRNHQFVVHTYLGEIDYWNLKPPFAFWGIALSYHLLGVNALAFRFVSALCLPASAAVLMLFAKPYIGRYPANLAGFLLAMMGVQMNHLFLHGDADALFFFFWLLALVFFCRAYLRSPRNLIGTGLFLAGAFLTKASHAAVLMLILALSAVILRKTERLSVRYIFLYAAVPAAVPVLLWAVWRFCYDGWTFFEQMLAVDVLSRATTGLEGNERGLFYYFQEMSRALGPFLFAVLLLAALCCTCMGFIKRKSMPPKDKVLISVACLAVYVPFLLYSAMTTKLSWYIWPSLIGLILLVCWLYCDLGRTMVRAKQQKQDATFAIFGCVVLTLALLIGLTAMPDHKRMQYYYDTSTLLPEASVFGALPPAQDAAYYVVDAQGAQGALPQSWILDGIFAGYQFRWGDMESACADNASALIILHNQEENAIERFQQSHPDLRIVVRGDSSVVFTRQ